MYILKNACLSIKRNKGRNILIGIIITVIACFLTVSLAIKNTSTSLIEAYESASDTTATIIFNLENMMKNFEPNNETNFNNMKEEFNKIESLSLAEIKEYGNSKYLKNFYYTTNINIDTDLEAATENFSFDKNKGNNNRPNNKEPLTNFTLTGYSTIEAMSEFIEGKYTITDSVDDLWNKILKGEYCLINSELATLNEINIGDTIKIKNSSTEITEVEIVGIFKETNNDNNEMSMFSNSANTLITNSSLVEELASANEDLKINVTPYFTLNSKDDIEEFTLELQEKGLNENYTLQTNESEISNATSSVKNVSNFATTFLVITIIIGVVVLCILNLINIRERKYEIGVLRTIGMKKSAVVLEFILELTIISLFALILGASLGANISKPLSNNLLSNEIKSSTENKEQLENNFGRPNTNNATNKNEMGENKIQNSFHNISGIVNVEAFDSINAEVNIKVIIELMGICLFLVMISSSCAILNIVRFRPLSILKERT